MPKIRGRRVIEKRTDQEVETVRPAQQQKTRADEYFAALRIHLPRSLKRPDPACDDRLVARAQQVLGSK